MKTKRQTEGALQNGTNHYTKQGTNERGPQRDVRKKEDAKRKTLDNGRKAEEKSAGGNSGRHRRERRTNHQIDRRQLQHVRERRKNGTEEGKENAKDHPFTRVCFLCQFRKEMQRCPVCLFSAELWTPQNLMSLEISPLCTKWATEPIFKTRGNIFRTQENYEPKRIARWLPFPKIMARSKQKCDASASQGQRRRRHNKFGKEPCRLC